MKCDMMDISFYGQYLREKVNLCENSVRLYISDVSKFLGTNPEIDDLEHYNRFLMEHTIKKRGNHYYNALKHYVNFKDMDGNKKNQLLEGMIKAEIKDPKKETIYLTPEKRTEVINNLRSEKHQLIAIIQMITGVRAGDVIRLRRGRIHYEEHAEKPILRLDIIGKNQKRNNTYIFDEIVQKAILNYINSTFYHPEYYFIECPSKKTMFGKVNTDELTLYKENYTKYRLDLKQALENSGVDKTAFSTHDFRRCFSREIWDKYKDIQILQRVLNHADITSTMRYLKYSGLQNKDIIHDYQNNLNPTNT